MLDCASEEVFGIDDLLRSILALNFYKSIISKFMQIAFFCRNWRDQHLTCDSKSGHVAPVGFVDYFTEDISSSSSLESKYQRYTFHNSLQIELVQ